MEDKDFTKCFVFHDMDWVQDILHMSELGLWNMVTDKDMQNVKFYIDGTMARLLGAKENMSPEACFEFWYKRINRGNHAYVNDVMNRIVHTVKLCETIEPYMEEKLRIMNEKGITRVKNIPITASYMLFGAVPVLENDELSTAEKASGIRMIMKCILGL